jgi:1-acyl-sn-glycerol-3-phosphate acyltransferase
MRLGSWIFCNKIIINKPDQIKAEGPLLIAANHPNSLLDALILCTLFKEPIWSLARGDVFKKPFIARLLGKLKILPVYRTREGVENLETNYQTFAACKEIFKTGGIVLIFSEGLCINEWHLRPLKKGTARLALSAWQDGIDLKILPTGINYNSFRKFGKNVFINFGETISSSTINPADTDGRKHLLFNTNLQHSLQALVFEIPEKDYQQQKNKLAVKQLFFTKTLLLLPAAIGFLVHAPLYIPLKKYAGRRTKGTDHYDSVLTAFLVFIYPLYLLMASLILAAAGFGWFSLLALALFPLLARALVVVKN